MVGVYPDIYNIFNILREVPTNATIQNNKMKHTILNKKLQSIEEV